MVLHGKPLKAPSLNVVFQRNVEVLSLPASAKFQASTSNKLMLPSSHAGPTMIKVPPESEMGKNHKKSLAQVYENDNLENGVGI